MSAELIRELITGMQLAYDALSKGFTDEAMLHLGHHLAKADRACATPPPQPSVSEGSEAQTFRAGWGRMTDEARRIQRRHLDDHQGDVYHAMQSLAVKFGLPIAAPQPTTKKG